MHKKIFYLYLQQFANRRLIIKICCFRQQLIKIKFKNKKKNEKKIIKNKIEKQSK